MIHSLDAAQAQRTLAEFIALGVHDAFIFSVDSLMDGGKRLNEVFADINSNYSITESVLSRLDDINKLTDEQLDALVGKKAREAFRLALTNFKTVFDERVDSVPRLLLDNSIREKNNLVSNITGWHQFPLEGTTYTDGSNTDVDGKAFNNLLSQEIDKFQQDVQEVSIARMGERNRKDAFNFIRSIGGIAIETVNGLPTEDNYSDIMGEAGKANRYGGLFVKDAKYGLDQITSQLVDAGFLSESARDDLEAAKELIRSIAAKEGIDGPSTEPTAFIKKSEDKLLDKIANRSSYTQKQLQSLLKTLQCRNA
jgi:hypothetical protein